jgi:TolB-like protein/Flp pilus assembly protein TadD
MSFIEELKRRKVFRVAASYAVVAFIIMQLVEILFPMFNFPQWTQQFTVIIVLLGFPIAVILSWVFDKTPQGFIKTDVNETQEINGMNIKVDKRPFYLQKRNIFLVLGVFGGILIGTYSSSTISNKIDSKSIAVLPFDNYSTAPEDQYFSDGITEVIIAHLAKIKDFTVISRTSVMGYKGTTKSLKDIGKELGVAHILEGSVQRAGDEIRIVSQLIETKSDKHLWAETYDEKLNSLFAVQSDIAKKIALAMETEISGDVERRIDERPTENINSWEDYLKGLEFNDRSNRIDDLNKAQFFFDKAFQNDPKFAASLARSASVDLLLYWYGFDFSQSRINKSKSKIDKATLIKADDPQVLRATGTYYYYGYRDYSNALIYYNKALELEPGNSAHTESIGYIYRRQGKIKESLANHQRAMELEPNDPSLFFQISLTYHHAREYNDAEEMIDRALQIVPDNQINLQRKFWYQFYKHRDLNQLITELYDLRKRLGDTNYSMTNQIVLALILDRKYELALDELDKVEDIFNIQQDSYIPYDFIRGNIFGLMGLNDQAIPLYNSAANLLEKELLKNPKDIRVVSDLGMIYAYLNKNEDAMRMIESAISEVPIEKDYSHGAYYNKQIEINLVLGNSDKAIKMIDRSANIFAGINYFDLIHPKWDSIRVKPQFKVVLKSLNTNQ